MLRQTGLAFGQHFMPMGQEVHCTAVRNNHMLTESESMLSVLQSTDSMACTHAQQRVQVNLQDRQAADSLADLAG